MDMYYVGLDVHKKTISYCVKDAGKSTSKERLGPHGWSWTAG